jgi:hypothetical protein
MKLRPPRRRAKVEQPNPVRNNSFAPGHSLNLPKKGPYTRHHCGREISFQYFSPERRP